MFLYDSNMNLIISLFVILAIVSVYYLYFKYKINILLFESFVTNGDSDSEAKNIILLGDSILNNSIYTLPKESVPSFISTQLEKTPEKTLYNLAKDGATISDCASQLLHIPPNLNQSLTRVFISAGGNDILKRRELHSDFIAPLFSKYMDFVKSVKDKLSNCDLVLLKLYYPFNPTYIQYKPVITQWNKLLDEHRLSIGYQLLETDKLIVSEDDIVYDVEPSAKGGLKIASAIVDYLVI